MMCLPSVGIVQQPISLAISRCVIENGTENFVTSESTNVRIVPTGNSLLLHTTTFSIILQERMHGDVML